MYFKTLFTTSLLLLVLIFSLSANNQVDKALASEGALLHATATEVESVDRSLWVWRNMFNNNSGAASTRLVQNDDTLGGKTCYLADDFVVGQDSTWVVDTLRTYLFWNRKAPDKIQVMIWPDFYGLPSEDTILHNFSFTVNMPNQLTIYDMKVGVTNQNITLTQGTYWISFIGVYETGTWAADTFVTYWNIKDTLIGPTQVQCMDSIGAAYTTQYPTPWLGIWFTGGNQQNSVKFWIKADVQTSIKSVNQQKTKSLVSVYPNPASEHLQFSFDNANGNYIEMYDLKGKLVKTVTALTKSQTVNVKPFTSGIYFYQLMDKSGAMVERGRFSVTK